MFSLLEGEEGEEGVERRNPMVLFLTRAFKLFVEIALKDKSTSSYSKTNQVNC